MVMIGLGDGLNLGVEEASGIILESGNVKSAFRPLKFEDQKGDLS